MGTAVMILGLVGGTLPSVWACAANERAGKSHCCCPEREPSEDVGIAAACCCLIPSPAADSAPNAQVDRPPQQDLAAGFIALAPMTIFVPAPARSQHPTTPTRNTPLTLVSLHTSLRC